ncbi:MAG: ATP-binding protein [Spirochaetota bacterium]|nr:ATP-binding protein [Spirochaetota bacterium]
MSKMNRILYIDDNSLDRELVRDSLEIEYGNFQVIEATSIEEFNIQLSDGDFDLVLSDFNILGFEGLEVIDAVKRKDFSLPIVIVTGTGSEEIAVEAMKRGADDYVIKTPSHIRRLPQTIHAAIEKKRLQVEHKLAEEELVKYRYHLEELVKERTKELNEAQEKLIIAERLAVLGEFSGNLSHELRNPLGIIESSAYYIQTKLSDSDSKLKQHINRIREQVRRSRDIINSLVNLANLKKPRKDRIDLTVALNYAISTLNIPNTVEINVDIQDEKVAVYGDMEQLCITFNNIINNAIEAMEGKGRLAIKMRVSNEDDIVEIIFEDTGPGIASENKDRIFRPLFSTKNKGIGFGLSICQQIILNHNGIIEVESEPGRGACFIIRLPI